MPLQNDQHATNARISVQQMMNTQYRTLRSDDSLRTVVQAFKETRLDTLPVVDDKGMVSGVFPRRRLYNALLEGKTLNDPCTQYIIESPIVLQSDQTYDEVSMAARLNEARVGMVPVVDGSGRLIGMIGKLEYLRETLNLATTSYASIQSIFQATYEGMIVVDNDGYILRVNESAENIFGIQSSLVRGLPLGEVFPEIQISRQLQLGMKASVRSIPVILNQAPIWEENKQIGVNIAVLDVSDVENMVEELEMVKELQGTISGVISASSDGVFLLDSFGAIKYANEPARNLVPGQIIGRQLSDYLNSKSMIHVAQTGIAEVDVCRINGKSCIASHVPLKKEDAGEGKTVGVISTVYLDDNRITEEITRKWFSLRQQAQYYRDELEIQGVEKSSFDQIVSRNPELNKKKEEAQHIAQSSSTILLTGESGVGKDMFARAIHATSQRANHPFVKVNCAAIPETLLESELFGYAPGSFTGALKSGRTGYFGQADQGTIFLDEIGDMPLSIQVKILQVIQEKQFMRVGGTSPQKVDVRIIAATNRDLREAIAKGAFREDLFYRLDVIQFNLPPLRRRPEDILPLAEVFIQKYNQILGTSVVSMSKAVQEALEKHSWPGNVRELENAIERAANYAWEGEIGIEHLPSHILHKEKEKGEEVLPSYRSVLNDVDKDIILDALRKTDGNKSAAARLLKISRSAFYEKLAKHGLQ